MTASKQQDTTNNTYSCLRTLEGHSGDVNSVCLMSADAPAPQLPADASAATS